MIQERIQALFKEAVFNTCVQGTRAGYINRSSGRFTCAYEDDVGNRCAVGHALPPKLLELARHQVVNVEALAEHTEAIGVHLGMEDKEAVKLWTALQILHDGLRDEARPDHWHHEHRPFGVSWSAWLWRRARTLSIRFGFDIGNYPRHAVQDAQAQAA